MVGGRLTQTKTGREIKEGRGGMEETKKEKKENHTSKQTGGYKRRRRSSRADKDDAFIGGKRRFSPTYSDVLSVFPLMALATHAKAFVCPSCHFISILSTTKCRYLRRVSAS